MILDRVVEFTGVGVDGRPDVIEVATDGVERRREIADGGVGVRTGREQAGVDNEAVPTRFREDGVDTRARNAASIAAAVGRPTW